MAYGSCSDPAEPSNEFRSIGPRSGADLANEIEYGIESPRRTETGIVLDWQDLQDMKEGTVTKTYWDNTLPTGPYRRTVEYKAPFFRPDREEDYRIAWECFSATGGRDEA